jgi:hypothetical protein
LTETEANMSANLPLRKQKKLTKRVTRDIDLESVRDLLERDPRSCIAFSRGDEPQTQPIAFVWRTGCYLAGISENAEHWPNPGDEVVLLIDEGLQFFELRAIYIRGRVKPVPVPEIVSAGFIWFEIEPIKTVAWDYGKLREARDEG